MPAVGMRRSTRVFGLVMKGADSGRVLRSGRRLWPENSVEAKTKRGNVNEGDDWSKPPTPPKKTAKNDVVLKPGAVLMTRQQGEKRGRDGVDRRFGIVYSRKRRRVQGSSSELSRRKGGEEKIESGSRSVLSIVVKPCAGNSGWFSSLLVLVLGYIAKVEVTLEELSSFFLYEPINGAFASRGVQFLQGPPTANIGICQFFGITQFMPLFCVDFAAVPLYFEYLHYVMLLKSMFRSFFFVHNPITIHSDVEDDEMEIDFPEHQNKLQISCNVFKREPSENGTVTLDVAEINDNLSSHSSVKCTRVAGRNGQYRNIMNSRGIRKRRSSLRKRKARNPSTMSLRRSNGALALDLIIGRKNNSQLSGVTSGMKLRNLTIGSPTGNLKQASSTIANSAGRLDSSVCSANILITESDQCYRVEGAIVTLEMPTSRECLLAVKKDGLTRCSFTAEKVIRPYSSNRFTHAIMFSLDNGWKLEFSNRQDWTVFKDLYKECSDRSIPAPVAKFIPVPGVREVSSYAECNCFPFHRPDTYISAYGDELTRAMTRKTANYDMDSEDEEWLSKFNNEFQEHVSEDNFELIIDALEKFCYCKSDDSFDEKSAVTGCQDLGGKEVVEAVYTYWMRKRKQKRSFLIRVFQSHQAKRAPLIPKPLLRKRRSFKRQPSQFSRSNQPSVLKAMAAEQDALEENAMLRIEEAKASANVSMELAIEKRKRAQFLAENADLATYKATMLIKIAEAAMASEAVDAAAGYFLD
ncbi:Enhancer of polycomb-like, N-terminal [Sesbania bispinosa]|nr:Enhancer of polycomb-like, N-terminal [Sesbania bispinosa]